MLVKKMVDPEHALKLTLLVSVFRCDFYHTDSGNDHLRKFIIELTIINKRRATFDHSKLIILQQSY